MRSLWQVMASLWLGEERSPMPTPGSQLAGSQFDYRAADPGPSAAFRIAREPPRDGAARQPRAPLAVQPPSATLPTATECELRSRAVHLKVE